MILIPDMEESDSSSPEFFLFLLNSLYDSSAIVEPPWGLRNEQHSTPPDGRFLPDLDRGVVNVLDALAAFCVFKASEQVTTVSASLTPKGTKLWIAQNEPVPVEVEMHIESLWAILRRLANSLTQRPSPPDQDSPDSNKTPYTMPIVAGLRLAIYQLLFAKVRQRTLKHYEKWLPVLDSLRAYESPGPHSPDDLNFRLADDLTALLKFAKAKIPVNQAAGYFLSIARRCILTSSAFSKSNLHHPQLTCSS
jgi:hypothetical protein